jgi:hypothetical protein
MKSSKQTGGYPMEKRRTQLDLHIGAAVSSALLFARPGTSDIKLQAARKPHNWSVREVPTSLPCNLWDGQS